MRVFVVAGLIVACGCSGTTVPDPVDFPDAASRDAAPAPDATGAAPDAAAPDADTLDASPLDAGSFTVDLTASATTATTAASIVLAAVPMGLTATTVAFFDNDVRIGEATTPPFTFSLRYGSTDNGVHVLRAVAFGAAGEQATSNIVRIRVAIERGVYVDPANGDDTNPGSAALPLRTITRATRLATAGENIFLLDGTYGAGEANPGNCIAIPPGVSLRAVRPGRVQIIDPQIGPACAFQFSGDALIDGIDLQNHDVGILFLSGTSTVQRVRVNGSFHAFETRGTARVTVIEPVVTGIRPSGFGVGVAVADGESLLTFRGGVFENAAAQTGMFMVRGAGELVLDGSVIRNNAGSAVRVNDNAQLVLRDVLIENCGLPGPGVDQASINVGGQNTQSVRTIGVRLERTRIVGARGHGIGVLYYGNLPSLIEVDLVDSAVTDSGRVGLFINPLGAADPALMLNVRVLSSTIARNAGGGVLAGLAALDIEDSEFRGNGVAIGATVHPASLRVHGSTFVESEVTMTAGTPTRCDLGTAATPGDNVFQSNGTGITTGLGLAGAVSCTAVGNTWLPLVQGADANGRYPAAGSIVAGPVAGANYSLVPGATLER